MRASARGERSCRVGILLILQRQHLSSNEPRVPSPAGDPECEDDQCDALPQGCREDHREEKGRESIGHVDNAHQDAVDESAAHAGDGAHHGTDGQLCQGVGGVARARVGRGGTRQGPSAAACLTSLGCFAYD